MSASQSLANRFREVILNGTWIANTNFKNQLTDLNFEMANIKVNGLNSIALLAQHIHYYIAGINNVMKGRELEIRDKYSFDFPDFESQNEWDSFLNKFWLDSEDFARNIELLNEDQLQSIFKEEKYGTFIRNIDAMIEHSYYHLGQIVLIEKFIKALK